jgi:16S rRNA (cytidine1402-2'-O)-methyltransferase
MVVIVEGTKELTDTALLESQRILQLLLEKLSLKEAVAITVKITGLKKNIIYDQALNLRPT